MTECIEAAIKRSDLYGLRSYTIAGFILAILTSSPFPRTLFHSCFHIQRFSFLLCHSLFFMKLMEEEHFLGNNNHLAARSIIHNQCAMWVCCYKTVLKKRRTKSSTRIRLKQKPRGKIKLLDECLTTGIAVACEEGDGQYWHFSSRLLLRWRAC